MILDSSIALLTQVLKCPYFQILSTLWITYSYLIFRGGHVSDDLQGIAAYDGTLMYPVEDKDGKPTLDKEGKVIKARKICYGTLSKWVRYHLCGGHFPSRHHQKLPDGKEGEAIESGKISTHHHVLSLVIASIACILLYQFLLTITTPIVSILTILLFIVQPTCVQAVAWPSAIGYILSLVCICASLLISTWTMGQTTPGMFILGLGGLAFFQILGVYAQAIPMFTWVIMLVLGQWQMAVVAFLASGAIAMTNLKGYVTFRNSEFKKQNMGQSTSFNIRKPIVALKTLAYYIYLSVFPAKLGLYHKWGFHYDKKVELLDWRAICGLLFLGLSLYFFFTGGIEVRVGLAWFYVFLALFLNWITAQQWVTERYLYIPVIGLCLITCLFLQHNLYLYWFIFGMFMCRSMVHMPTYENELRFYLSNTWNFQDSEVAFGNLGVAYTSAGLSGASNDMWVIAGSINPDYDVPFYNIFARVKSQGMLMIQNGAYEQGFQAIASAVPLLEKTLSCKTLHYKDMWEKELSEIKTMLSNPSATLVNELARLYQVRMSLNKELAKKNDEKRVAEILPSVTNNENQIKNLVKFLDAKGIKIDFNAERGLLSKLTGGR